MDFIKNIGYPNVDATKNLYEFAHLTLQEFMAAVYLVRGLQQKAVVPTPKRYEDAKQFILEKRYCLFYQIVFQFIAGILNACPSYQSAQEDFWQGLLSAPLDLTEVQHARLLARCLNQTHQDDKHCAIPHKTEMIVYLKQWIAFLFNLNVISSYSY